MATSNRIRALTGELQRRDITFRTPIFRKMRSVLNRELADQLKNVENEAFRIMNHPRIGNYVWAILKGAEPLEQLRGIAAKNEKAGKSFLLSLLEFHLKLHRASRGDTVSTSMKYPFFILPSSILDIMIFDRNDVNDWNIIAGMADRASYNVNLMISVLNAIKRTYSLNDIDAKILMESLRNNPQWSSVRNIVEMTIGEMEIKKIEEDRQKEEALALEKTRQAAADEKRAARIAKIRAKAAERKALRGDAAAADHKKAKGITLPVFRGFDEGLRQLWSNVTREGRFLMMFAGASSEKRFRGLLAGRDQSHNMGIWARQRNEAYIPLLRAYLNFQLALNRKLSHEVVFYRHPSNALRMNVETTRSSEFPALCDPEAIMRAMGLKRQ